jgi:hypothetical protein
MLIPGVDVDARCVVGGFNACAPHYSHANEILEGDTALHIAIRNRKKEALRKPPCTVTPPPNESPRPTPTLWPSGPSPQSLTPAPRPTQAARFLLDCGARRDLKAVDLAQQRGMADVFYVVAKPEQPMILQEPTSQDFGATQTQTQAYAPTAPAQEVHAAPAPSYVPHDVDIGVDCEGFDRVPKGEEMKR